MTVILSLNYYPRVRLSRDCFGKSSLFKHRKKGQGHVLHLTCEAHLIVLNQYVVVAAVKVYAIRPGSLMHSSLLEYIEIKP
jgi:hypothetical protein